MTNPGAIWRQRLWVWLPALLFFAANAVAFAIYLGYAGRVERLNEQLESQDKEVTRLTAKRKELETLVNRVRTNGEQVERLYSERFAPRSQRLTSISAEVYDLARKAGLSPQAISSPEEEIEEYGLIKRSYIFTVEGTYSELRKFINLLELSKSFLTLEGVTLSGGDEDQEGSELRMDLNLSTLFTREPGDELPPAPAAVASGATGRTPS
ncbi:MAG TPA: type 4a pilus biogenesis protein PilO [Thermoanaerobaculia bacterium]|nr:type 4a pilus biogenesis protein PilO [Thermoanaerobaculia bacterium]